MKKKADVKDDTNPELLKTPKIPDYSPKSHFKNNKYSETGLTKVDEREEKWPKRGN